MRYQQFVCSVLFRFIVYSILGWCIDTLTRSLILGTWTADNSLSGFPFSPMYGIGGLLILFLFRYIQRRSIIMQWFFYAVILAIFEYVGGVFSVWFLGRRVWDYSHIPLNIGGHTDPLHAVVWGMLALLLVYWLDPLLMRSVRRMFKARNIS